MCDAFVRTKKSIQRGLRDLVVDLLPDGSWRVWTAPSPDYTLGTYMLLRPDGSIAVVTERADQSPQEVVIKPAS